MIKDVLTTDIRVGLPIFCVFGSDSKVMIDCKRNEELEAGGSRPLFPGAQLNQ
jgi:hypothetical protein